METPITFLAETIALEGLLQRIPGEKGVVVTHPHSLYGGNMYNPVVEEVCREYHKQGFTTLRFNFRGVGTSGGSFDNGCGEEKDVLAAVQYLLSSGIDTIHLVGYSFGARVLAGIHELPLQVETLVFVAPPVAFMDFTGVAAVKHLKRVIVGKNDDIAPPSLISNQISTWNPEAELDVIDNCDHFFGSSLKELKNSLRVMLSSDGA